MNKNVTTTKQSFKKDQFKQVAKSIQIKPIKILVYPTKIMSKILPNLTAKNAKEILFSVLYKRNPNDAITILYEIENKNTDFLNKIINHCNDNEANFINKIIEQKTLQILQRA